MVLPLYYSVTAYVCLVSLAFDALQTTCLAQLPTAIRTRLDRQNALENTKHGVSRTLTQYLTEASFAISLVAYDLHFVDLSEGHAVTQ